MSPYTDPQPSRGADRASSLAPPSVDHRVIRKRWGRPPLPGLSVSETFRRMRRAQSGYARARRHPDLVRLWALRAVAIRDGRTPPEVPLVMTPRAVEMRMRRDLARRRAAFAGVKYHDRMASDPLVVRAVREQLGLPWY